jgi:hypothetical protein
MVRETAKTGAGLTKYANYAKEGKEFQRVFA